MCKYLTQQLHGLMNRWTTDRHGCAYVHACNLVNRFCSFCRSRYTEPKHLIDSHQRNMIMHLVHCNSHTLHIIKKKNNLPLTYINYHALC